MIANSGELIRELKKKEDDFVTVLIDDREYIIDFVKRKPSLEEFNSSYLQLVCRDGGNGYIRR